MVTISGGADASGHHYTWTIRNRHSSPIVYVEIPHHRADLFTPPDGWTQSRPERGVLAATADSVDVGITSGRPGVFYMRISAGGAGRGTGTIRVRFQDGTEVQVGGVTLPQPPSDRYAAPIGLSAIFALWLAVRILRRRRSRRGDKPQTLDHGTT